MAANSLLFMLLGNVQPRTLLKHNIVQNSHSYRQCANAIWTCPIILT